MKYGTKTQNSAKRIIKACLMFVLEVGLFEEVRKKHPGAKYDPTEKFVDEVSVGAFELCEEIIGPLTVKNHGPFTRAMNQLCDRLIMAPDTAPDIVAEFVRQNASRRAA